ncbi:MAG TPA: DNA mismatch repair protein MutS [Bacillota bacterium]|nr:DNA mismatch repair protein MutS [Bacillota bacterium]
MNFQSILFSNAGTRISGEEPDYFHDLNLDQVVGAIVEGKQEYDLKPFYHTPLRSAEEVTYRQEVMKDAEKPELLSALKAFAGNMRSMRELLKRNEKLHYHYQKEFYFLKAVRTYCEAVQGLFLELSEAGPDSKGFQGFYGYLREYTASAPFLGLVEEERAIRSEFDAVKYNMLVKGECVRVSGYEGERNYSDEIESTFEKFQQGAVKSFLRDYQTGYDMNHVEAAILDNVAKLYPEIFGTLDHFCNAHGDFIDQTVLTFDREIQFYVAFIDYAARFRSRGLAFCYPGITRSKEIYDYGGFDLALANNLMKNGGEVVCNDFCLKDQERIFVVTGPNQGGKTTFARAFGQLHYLSGIGCMVPGTRAQLFLPDRIYCHFEREEAAVAHVGKLKDDLIRIYAILKEATPDSIVIINEIFSSATLKDAISLGRKIFDRMNALDLIGVCVTFIDELASYSDKIVSLSSTVLAEDPSVRTYTIIRKPADGLAYAISIAEKYRLTYNSLKERIRA